MKARSQSCCIGGGHGLPVRLLLSAVFALGCMVANAPSAQAQTCRGDALSALTYPSDGAIDVSLTTPFINSQNMPDVTLGEPPPQEPDRELLFEAGADAWVRAETLSSACPVVFLPVEPLKPNQWYEFRSVSGETTASFLTGDEEGGPALSIQVGPDLDPSEMLEMEVESSRPVVVVLLSYSYPYDVNGSTYRAGLQLEFTTLESGRLRVSHSIPEAATATFVGAEGQLSSYVTIINDRPPEETEADADDKEGGGCTCALCRTRQGSLCWGVLAAMGLVLAAGRRRRRRW
jgi:hypothetical protein